MPLRKRVSQRIGEIDGASRPILCRKDYPEGWYVFLADSLFELKYIDRQLYGAVFVFGIEHHSCGSR